MNHFGQVAQLGFSACSETGLYNNPTQNGTYAPYNGPVQSGTCSSYLGTPLGENYAQNVMPLEQDAGYMTTHSQMVNQIAQQRFQRMFQKGEIKSLAMENSYAAARLELQRIEPTPEGPDYLAITRAIAMSA